jgi:hypothetical protein
MDGVPPGLYQPVPTQIGLGVESERQQRVHSASCVAVMVPNLRQLVVQLLHSIGCEWR